jgi:hypothetical protein
MDQGKLDLVVDNTTTTNTTPAIHMVGRQPMETHQDELKCLVSQLFEMYKRGGTLA